MAVTITLGVGCKKDSNLNAEAGSKIEKVKDGQAHDHTTATVNPNDGPGGNPGYVDSELNFPHNSGVCNCGKFAGCHPREYAVSWTDSQGFDHFIVHTVMPGQTVFPAGAWFPGN